MKKIGVVFSGFGSQFVGMAKDAYDNSRAVQEYFEEAYNCLNINFVKLCFASSDEDLNKIDHVYLATFLADISLYSLLIDHQIIPQVVAGRDIGFYAALFAAEGFTLPDALYLLNKYASFYQDFLDQHKDYSLIKVTGLSLRKINALCKEYSLSEQEALYVAIVYDEQTQVIAGHNKAIKKLEKVLNNLKQIVISDSDLRAGFNCELAQPFIDIFKMYLMKVDFKDVKIPVLSNLNGKVLLTGKAVKKDLINQELETIMWPKVLHSLSECDVIIEVGPGKLIASQLQSIYADKQIFVLNQTSDLIKIKESLELNFQDNHEK